MFCIPISLSFAFSVKSIGESLDRQSLKKEVVVIDPYKDKAKNLEIAASLPTSRDVLKVGRTFGEIMKYVCFGDYDQAGWTAMSESEQQRFMDECFAYDDVLRKNGPIVGRALETVRNAKTLRLRNGRVRIMDGPYAETKEPSVVFFWRPGVWTKPRVGIQSSWPPDHV
jgi:hypothetical protein